MSSRKRTRQDGSEEKEKTCCASGPGYASPMEAFKNSPKEKILYIVCVVPDASRPDYLSTVDCDPESATYSQVIHRLPMSHCGDELHHSGWNSCSSCHDEPGAAPRSRLILPGMVSGRVYAVDTATDPKAPKIIAEAQPEDVKGGCGGLGFLHTTHCLPSGEIMVSTMGDKDDRSRGDFLVLDQELKVKGSWATKPVQYGYDFWYQPRINAMVSTAWGAPKAFKKGFNPAEIEEHYGSSIYFWDWEKKEMIQEVPLGPDGMIPLECRFLHEPTAPHGYVGAALASNIIHFTKADGEEKWTTNVVVKQPWLKVEGWVLPEMPPLTTDILISMDDKYLYWSNWLRGDICQYDITDPANPKLAGRVWTGGAIRKGSSVKVLDGMPEDCPEVPEIPEIKGCTLHGGPQMIQLSLDGKRLYVTNSLFSVWDKQFYPDMVDKGSCLLQIDVDTEKGGMKINTDFIVNYGAEPDGPVLAHEVRYPGGDCSSDIWK